MSRVLSKEEINNILSEVPVEKGFRFQTGEGRSTNVTAISLEDLAEKMIQIDIASIDFHYPRGDFQTWVRDVVKDNELADRLCYIKKEDSGEKLRKNILNIVQKRILELKTSE
jgi:hypothetical protein